jgi:hypothetical protein
VPRSTWAAVYLLTRWKRGYSFGAADFAATVPSSIGGAEHAQAHIAFHLGAMYMLQIAQHVIADRSGEEVSLALGMLDAELDQFMKSHAIVVQ